MNTIHIKDALNSSISLVYI
uniref:Uncharacterized protein n=1 Tax=Lepeophtheirus salmonis TaxID=72036 RepID=A0A0K2TFU9_LEPSM